jgi:hypothetical protein
MTELKIVVNGKPMPGSEWSEIVRALSDPAIATEKGGYLFKSHLDGDTLRIGILPCIVNGMRSYHYNIDIERTRHVLIGTINPNGTATVLFRLNREEAKKKREADALEYRRQFAGLAMSLVSRGFPPDFELDSITIDALREAGICDATAITFGDLAGWTD